VVARSAVGLIAGSGRLPVLLAEAVKSRGHVLVVISFDRAPAAAARLADHHYEIGLGELQSLLAVLQAHHVRELVSAGGIPRIPPPDRTDAAFRELTASGRERSGQSLFHRGVELLASRGIQMRGPLDLRPDLATPAGVLTARGPSPAQEDDIRHGMSLARMLAGEEIGQTIAVTRGVVVAVEAAEGTDETIRRAGAYAPAPVVVKAARPDQDLRFDLPTAGPETIDVMRRAGASVLALEAGRTLLLDREVALAQADEAGIVIVGVEL
jgi:DUF1009 family protein